MKARYLIIILNTFFLCTLLGQPSDELTKGNISFVSSQNTYVKFTSTEGIHVGDTLFAIQNNRLHPALIVTSLSSISCVTSSIPPFLPAVSTQIMAKRKNDRIVPEAIAPLSKLSAAVTDSAITAIRNSKTDTDKPKARFDGRIAVSSYSYMDSLNSSQRFRYNVSLHAEHINNSKFSAEIYSTFTHKLGESFKFNDALKIYSLSVQYELSKTARISVGRKINLNMANIGAVDGLQYEQKKKHFGYGALIGSRPDYFDYRFNPKLMQMGAFISHSMQNENGTMQSSVAIFNQMNDFKTDRRFAYIQHSNSLLRKVDLFCSLEIDLYTQLNLKPTSTFDLTSTYLSIRYKPWKQWSMSLSYDARKNIYYYETFKNQIDSILDKETRQGFRYSTIIRPFKYFIVGGNAGYRLPIYQKTDTIAKSMNANAYISYAQLPFGLSATLSATAFRTNYTNGDVYGISMSRDFFAGKWNAEFEYRLANYSFKTSPAPLKQNIGELSLFWRIAKKLTLSADLEATFEKDAEGNNNRSARLFINISQRF